MKRIFTILALLALVYNTFATTPQKISYQGIVRDANAIQVRLKTIGMQISILQGSVTGTEVYVETQSPTTTDFGLVSVEIGSGSVVLGNFSSIDWASGPYFLKVETDIEGGTNYDIVGTSELLTVPYAQYAVKAGSVELTGTEVVFDGWDKDVSDDFSGDYEDLSNRPDFSDTAIYVKKEVDPIFTSSVAANISASDTTRWANGGAAGLPTVAVDGNLLSYDGSNWVAKDVALSAICGNAGASQPVYARSPFTVVNYCIALQGPYPSCNFMDPFIGAIGAFGFNFVPRNWAACNGQLLSVNDNPTLFSLLGMQYGGDGRTTFGLPDLRGRAAISQGQGPGLSYYVMGQKGGSEYITLSEANMPIHNHALQVSIIK